MCKIFIFDDLFENVSNLNKKAYQKVSVLAAIGLSEDYRKIFGASESMKEEKENWRSVFVRLEEHGLAGERPVIGDKN